MPFRTKGYELIEQLRRAKEEEMAAIERLRCLPEITSDRCWSTESPHERNGRTLRAIDGDMARIARLGTVR